MIRNKKIKMKKIYNYIICGLAFSVVACSCGDNQNNEVIINKPVNNIDALNYDVVNIHPHNVADYTEGLEVYNGFLYEGTGNYKASVIKKYEIKTGKSLQQIAMPDSVFGEGITILNNKIYQLTYQENTVFVYDLKTMKLLKQFNWPYGEGWGLTNDGKQLIASTGSANLYFLNPETLSLNKSVQVKGSDNSAVPFINELEYVNGNIYANLFQSNTIVRINPETGVITGSADFTDILKKNNLAVPSNHESVLNGIAYDSTKNSFYITGKNWPALFEIKFK